LIHIAGYVLPKSGVKTWLMLKRQVAGEKIKGDERKRSSEEVPKTF